MAYFWVLFILSIMTLNVSLKDFTARPPDFLYSFCRLFSIVEEIESLMIQDALMRPIVRG